MKVQKGLQYTNDHEWVKVEGDVAVIGVADYAQHHLGDIVYVELPEIDDEIEREEAFSAVESVKAAADIYMPVSGKVVAINEELIDDPALLNSDPYENWMIKVEMTNKAELDELMTSEDYEKFLAEEE
ncbi:glycine cleavage system protein GcvH [Tissierella sp. MB52-C2]|uniref:glycine cleavage system protein GcvH n=1 Tax=Tissierella sp. MB52-C2 TaxID=3070999 RepID=UPI00280B3918|nr:glycine cleavage system protein GcvH [Tissierella sp. MB52-C2]WMM25607.1 glycine cleavage system protein GcvH [Tissierella sp. MB52-C2]